MQEIIDIRNVPFVNPPSQESGFWYKDGLTIIESFDQLTEILPDEHVRHSPIPFHSLLSQFVKALSLENIGIESIEAVVKQNTVFGGIINLSGDNSFAQDQIAFWNSYNHSKGIGGAAGKRVGICINSVVQGEVQLSRRNSKYAHRDLYWMIPDMVNRLLEVRVKQGRMFEKYREVYFDRTIRAECLLDCVCNGAILPKEIETFKSELESPRFKEFEGLNNRAMGFLMAGTQMLHKADPFRVIERSAKLTESIEKFVA